MHRWAQGTAVGTALALIVFVSVAAGTVQGSQRPGEGAGGARGAPEPDLEVGVLICNLQAQGAEPEAESQARAVLCSFKPKAGTEETYVGTIRGIALDGESAAVVAWVVKAGSNVVTSGALQQSFNSDQAVPADQPSRLVGEVNPGIVLRPLADKPEGSAGAKDKPRPRGFVVLGLELTLQSATA